MGNYELLERFAENINTIYGFELTGVSPAPRGFAAETYYVETKAGTYFLKIMHNPRRQSLFINGLMVQEALIKQGIDFIPRVIPTVDGQLFFKKDGAVWGLYTVVPGKQSYEFDRGDAFEKLARIYEASTRIPQKDCFLWEQFHIGLVDAYEKQLKEFFSADVTGEEAKEVKALLIPHRDVLENCGEDARKAAAACLAEEEPFYLTHSDFPGNIMVAEDGRQYIIDFDEAIFGPLERDGWMAIVRENEESRIWLDVMQKAFPGYKPNRTFIRYYVYERFMADLFDFIRQLLYNSDGEYRRRIVHSTKDYLMGWLYPILLKYK